MSEKPGRKPIDPGKKKTTLTVCLSPDEITKVDKLAKKRKLSRSKIFQELVKSIKG